MEEDKIQRLNREWAEKESESKNGGYLIVYALTSVIMFIVLGVLFLIYK
jgi:hypothetical protein